LFSRDFVGCFSQCRPAEWGQTELQPGGRRRCLSHLSRLLFRDGKEKGGKDREAGDDLGHKTMPFAWQ